MRHLIFIALLFGATTAYASGGTAPNVQIKPYYNPASTNTRNLLEGVALNAAAPVDRTVDLATYGWSKLVVGVFFTRDVATTVTATFTCARDGNNYAAKTTRACASGACEVYPMVDTRTTSVSENFELEYDTTGCINVKVVFAGASAGASDLVNIQATSSAGL